MGSARVIGLPKSYRFDPIDEELLILYLYNKIHGKPLPSNIVIECNLYDEKEPWREVFKESKEKTHYFFTKLKKKSEKGSRIERGTRCSTWRSQRDEKIYLYEKDKKTHIGSKRNFSYVPKEGFKANGRWVMHEYRLDGFLLNNKTHHDEYVLCRVKKEKSKEEEEQQQEESITNSGINKRVPETECPESGGLKHLEQMSMNNTTGTAIAQSMIPQTPGVQKMEEWMGCKNTIDSLSDFKQDSSDESSPKYLATETMSSVMEGSCLNVVETKVQAQGHASVMPPKVSTNYRPVPESTYQLPMGSNEFSIPSADNEQMWNYQQQPVLLMNESFWGIPNSQKDNWLQALNSALDNFSHEPLSNNFE